mgnify:FL=1|tara:strand:- start:2141 stop:2503 length:363 start_codon:yes stop_codon:yes gene_type:complete
MTIQLALDKVTNDLIKPASGGVSRVDTGRYTVQLVKNRLQTQLGEWRLNPSLGWLSFETDFTKKPDLFDIELRATNIILNTTGVLAINSISIALEGRKLYLSFTASTIYGNIDLTIPWGN